MCLAVPMKIIGVQDRFGESGKPDELLKKYGLKKEECIFITDILGDILEANLAGIKTFAVNFGFHDEEVLKKGSPAKIISSFAEIDKLIN